MFSIITGLHGPVVRALTLKHWLSHSCGSSHAWITCEMPSSAPVGQVLFLWVLRFSPPDKQSSQYKLNNLERAINPNLYLFCFSSFLPLICVYCGNKGYLNPSELTIPEHYQIHIEVKLQKFTPTDVTAAIWYYL